MGVKVVFYDEMTGEILEETSDKDVVKAYLLLTLLMDRINDTEFLDGPIRLLLYAIKRANYRTFEVAIIPEETIKELGISKGTLYRWLRFLSSKGQLTKLGRNVYELTKLKTLYQRYCLKARRT